MFHTVFKTEKKFCDYTWNLETLQLILQSINVRWLCNFFLDSWVQPNPVSKFQSASHVLCIAISTNKSSIYHKYVLNIGRWLFFKFFSTSQTVSNSVLTNPNVNRTRLQNVSGLSSAHCRETKNCLRITTHTTAQNLVKTILYKKKILFD